MVKGEERPRKTLKPPVAVVGIGRVGLPLALFLTDKGHAVYGIDTDREKIHLLSEKQMPFIEEGAPKLLNKYLGKSFFVSTDF